MIDEYKPIRVSNGVLIVYADRVEYNETGDTWLYPSLILQELKPLNCNTKFYAIIWDSGGYACEWHGVKPEILAVGTTLDEVINKALSNKVYRGYVEEMIKAVNKVLEDAFGVGVTIFKIADLRDIAEAVGLPVD